MLCKNLVEFFDDRCKFILETFCGSYKMHRLVVVGYRGVQNPYGPCLFEVVYRTEHFQHISNKNQLKNGVASAKTKKNDSDKGVCGGIETHDLGQIAYFTP